MNSNVALKIALIFCCVLVVILQDCSNAKVKAEEKVKILESQIYVLQVESKSQQLKADIAQQEANLQMKESKEQIDKILAAKIDHGCESALKFAVDQAKRFGV